MDALRILLVAPLVILAAALLVTSAWVLVRQRPLLLRSSLVVGLIAVSMAPLALAMLLAAVSDPEPATLCSSFITGSLLALMIVAFGRATRGYTVIAVTEDSFRAAVRAALVALSIPYEETVLGFVLGTSHNTLRARIEPRIGTAQLNLKSPDTSQILPQIAGHIRDRLGADRLSMSLGSALIYGALGLLILAAAFYQASRF